MENHAGRARENGADEREIAMAIEIGKSVRKGSAARMDEFISTVFKT
ncbi:MAG: hypothetical protein M0Z67_14135 [Nitrospiraceae bacterium]|nr:hypothetical protein [Nitrospiraceae bacterium]